MADFKPIDNNATIPDLQPAQVVLESMENKNLLEKRGDIYVGTGSNSSVQIGSTKYIISRTSKLEAGNQGQILVVDNNEPNKLKWGGIEDIQVSNSEGFALVVYNGGVKAADLAQNGPEKINGTETAFISNVSQTSNGSIVATRQYIPYTSSFEDNTTSNFATGMAVARLYDNTTRKIAELNQSINSQIVEANINFTNLSNCTRIYVGDYGTQVANGGMALGYNASSFGTGSIVIGDNAQAANSSIALGYGAAAYDGTNSSIAIGNNAICTAAGAIQLGEGQNNVAGTVQIKGYRLLENNGYIANERFQMYYLHRVTLSRSGSKMVILAASKLESNAVNSIIGTEGLNTHTLAGLVSTNLIFGIFGSLNTGDYVITPSDFVEFGVDYNIMNMKTIYTRLYVLGSTIEYNIPSDTTINSDIINKIMFEY